MYIDSVTPNQRGFFGAADQEQKEEADIMDP